MYQASNVNASCDGTQIYRCKQVVLQFKDHRKTELSGIHPEVVDKICKKKVQQKNLGFLGSCLECNIVDSQVQKTEEVRLCHQRHFIPLIRRGRITSSIRSIHLLGISFGGCLDVLG